MEKEYDNEYDNVEWEQTQSQLLSAMSTEELSRLQESLAFDESERNRYRQLVGMEVIKRMGKHGLV